MAEAALIPPPVAEETDPREQARRWCRTRIVSSDIEKMRDELQEVRSLGGTHPYDADDDDIDDDDAWDVIPAEDGFAFVREASNHYPFPITEPILDRAISKIQRLVRIYHVNGVYSDGVERDEIEGIITAIMENPDALFD